MALDWEKIFGGFTACPTDEDCGALCRNGSRSVAACCDGKLFSLIAFTEELAWARPRTTTWRGKRPTTEAEKKAVAKWADHIAPARCLTPHNCDRAHRSLTCRFFPLEPYFDARNRFVGLTYCYNAARHCPVVRERRAIRQDYVDQSVVVWRQIFAAYPEERECYEKTSRQLRKRFAQQRRRIRIFRPTP
jgi:hypothetical protein